MSEETRTYDNSRLISHVGLKDVDEGFFNWWDKELNLNILDKDGQKRKVPVFFLTAERWFKAREEGLRDKHGTLILPIVVISRTDTSDATDGATQRTFADTRQYTTYSKQVDPKTSQIQNLIAARVLNVDPRLPIYEVYSAPVPDHYSLTYQVSVWSSYMDEINDIIEKIGQQFNYLSKKSFKFYTTNGFHYVALKDDEMGDDSNLEDYTGDERIIRKEYTFKVSAHILPQSDERKETFRRYFSQTKIVFKGETVGTLEDLQKLLKK